MTTEKLTVCDSWKPDFDASMAERFTVWLRNLYHWKTRWAVNHLSKQLRNDPEFRESWKANIAMPIYDEAGRCYIRVGIDEVPIGKGHLSIDECNHIADRLLKHLFGA